MNWTIAFLPEAFEDLVKLDGSIKSQILKTLQKVSQNPLPDYQGGYGKPLENQNKSHLASLLKIKFKKIGIRVVYKLELENSVMKIIIISVRADNQVYEEAKIRRKKYHL